MLGLADPENIDSSDRSAD